jgi:prevent-host-death family protein
MKFRLFLAREREVCILHIMQKANATLVARNFSEFLGEVEHGESVQILKHGRAVARLIPDSDFIDGSRISVLFQNHIPDPEAADAIEKEIQKLSRDEEDGLAH